MAMQNVVQDKQARMSSSFETRSQMSLRKVPAALLHARFGRNWRLSLAYAWHMLSLALHFSRGFITLVELEERMEDTLNVELDVYPEDPKVKTYFEALELSIDDARSPRYPSN